MTLQKHDVGTLATQLSTDIAMVHATTGPNLGLQIMNNVGILTGT
jgi:hypothetical protein